MFYVLYNYFFFHVLYLCMRIAIDVFFFIFLGKIKFAFSCQFLPKLARNWQKMAKIGKNWQEIDKNWQELAEIGQFLQIICLC